ncbi:MAG: hypothetical protein RL635_927, partial [Chloroflexota bacterium]
MCGLFALVGAADAALGRRVADCLHHRGPDDSGVWISASGTAVTMASTRLSIIDLSPGGHMPMLSADGRMVIVYNGEVYNFRELREELEGLGERFQSHSDTEVVLAAYRCWGAQCVQRLRGMFAFAIWEMDKQQLFAARDRLGIKPLYWTESPRGLAVASELKGLLAGGLAPRELDLQALHHYLTFYSVPPPHTMLAGVQALLPGHSLTWQAGRVTMHKYWDVPASAVRSQRMEYEEARRELRRLLEETIRLRMIADVPVGAFLSGGMDSSAVVALMTRISGARLKTFSVGFQAEGRSIDERSYARLVAAHCDTDHTEVLVDGLQVAAQLAQFVRAMDQPTGDGLNTFLVSQAAAQHVKVALSGLGADELFAGYHQFRYLQQAEPWARWWQQTPQWLQAVARSGSRLGAVAVGRPAIAEVPAWLSGDFLSRYLRTRTLYDEDGKLRLYADKLRHSRNVAGSADALTAYLDANDADVVAKVTRLELKGYMAHMLLRDTDAMSMAHSLEVRVPWIDHKLVEFAVGLPAEWKLRGGQPKAIFADALADVLPRTVLRRRKQGFEIPLA